MNIHAPVAPAAARPHGNHFVLFYETEHYLSDEVVNFIGAGLHAGESGIVIATPIHRKYMGQRLNPHISSLPADSAQYIELDAEDTLERFMINGWPDEQRFFEVLGNILSHASHNGERKIRIFGEMVAILWARGNREAAIRLEHLWGDISRRRAFTLFCAYPINQFAKTEDGSPFEAICNAHSHVIPAESFGHTSDQEKMLRSIAQLQQKAQALESEISIRKEFERLLRQREKELTDFIENAAEGLHRMDAQGFILWANKAELDLLGYAAEEYIGHHISEFHVDLEVLEDYLARLQRGETICDYRARLRCKNGTIRHVLVHANALLVDGELVYTRCFTRDVTDQVRLEQQLAERLGQLAEVDRRKDEFLAMLGHELRNPLAPITTSLALMRLQANNPDAVARSRDVIERQIALMKRLVDDLLDVSRITLGKLELKLETILLSAVVEQALELTRPLIDKLGHQLELDLPREPVSLPGDSARLAQVLANLLNNAAKYTSAGGKIRLSVRIEGTSLLVSVRDNGTGLTMEMRDRIFDLFIQGGSPLHHARGGLGVGLSLARTIVELHGGKIEVFSDGPGCGSEFVVRLPRHILSSSTIGPKNGDARGNDGARLCTILIVDDHVDAAESLGEYLKILGHEVRIAHDGYTALHMAAQFRPEIVILDIGMPAMDGYQLAGRLRAEGFLSSALFIALTGFANQHDSERAHEAGFDYHFSKPVDADRLTALIAGLGRTARPA